MNILVTGATGFIGRAVVEQLLKERHQVFALVRKSSKVDFLISQNVHLIFADIADKKSLQQLRDYSIQAVFHCAGYVKDQHWKALYLTNVIGTQNICQLCLEMRAERLVYVSSVAVVSGNTNVPLSENAPYAATNLYGRSKIDAERRVIEFRKKGLRVAILRPPMVYGEGEPHALGKILFLLKYGLMPLLGTGNCHWHLAYVKNVANGLLLALEKEECLQGTLFIADEEFLTVREIFTVLSRAIEGKAPYAVPGFLTSFATHVPYIGKTARSFLKDKIYDISRIKSLGYHAQYNPREALAASARHWLKVTSVK